MIYQHDSIQTVIARVIRNTRIQDTSYLFDMNEWIPEAMGIMRTKYELSTKYQDININFHKGKLPCDLHHIKAVEWEYGRLREGNSSKDITTSQNNNIAQSYNIQVSTLSKMITPTGNLMWTSAFTPQLYEGTLGLSYHKTAYYQVEMGYISTSFADSLIRVHYAAVPCDEQGLPLIPDNEEYKQALYYYIRAMMIGAGYVDTVFNEQELTARFEMHAARAISQIRYPSVDIMEQRVNNHVRFVPQANYFDNFFRTSGREGNL